MITVGFIGTMKNGELFAGSIDCPVAGQPAKKLGELELVEVTVQNRKTNNDGTVNATKVRVGDSGQQTFELAPGEHTEIIKCKNLRELYAVAF